MHCFPRCPIALALCCFLPPRSAFSQTTLDYTLVDHLGWKAGAVEANSVVESYLYDANQDVVTVVETFDTAGFAPLPPMLALAWEYGLPITFSSTPVPNGTNSDLGPLWGISGAQTYSWSFAGLNHTVLEEAIPGTNSPPQELQAELEAEVRKILDAGHLAPTLFQVAVPGSYSNPRGHVYWYNPGDIHYFLAEALPLLSPTSTVVQPGEVIEYLREERQSYPPEEIRALPYWEGSPRNINNPNAEILSLWWANDPDTEHDVAYIGFRTTGGPKIANLYGLARYYEAVNENPTQAIVDASTAIILQEMQHLDWASLYWQNGFWPEYNAVHAVNQLFAGLVGYIRLSRRAGDTQAEALGFGLLARMGALRFAMGKYTQFQYASGKFTFPLNNPTWYADQHVLDIQNSVWQGDLITFQWTEPIHNTRQIHRLDDQAVWTADWFGSGAGVCPNGDWCEQADGQIKEWDLSVGGWNNTAWASLKSPYLLPFADITPEMGRFMRAYLRQEIQVFADRIAENQAHWYVAYAEALLGYENNHMTPMDVYGHFMARAWVLDTPAEVLERYIDYPWVQVGDLFYLHKLATVIWAYRGVSCECSSGSCCDGCRFRSPAYACETNLGQPEYGCPRGTACGTDVFRRWQRKVCSGSAAECDGAAAWDTWQVADSCDSNARCQEGQTSCIADPAGCTPTDGGGEPDGSIDTNGDWQGDTSENEDDVSGKEMVGSCACNNISDTSMELAAAILFLAYRYRRAKASAKTKRSTHI